MSFRLQVVLFVFLTFVLVILITQLKKKKLDLKYALPWLFLDLVLIIFVLFPQTLEWCTHMLGIETPINMLSAFGFVLAMIIIYSQTVAIAKLSDNLRKLAQSVALAEHDDKLAKNEESKKQGDE